MLCNITQNSMRQTPGGYPARSSLRGILLGGYPAGGVPCWAYPAGGYPARGYPTWVPPSQVRTGGTLLGVPCQGGYPARGTQVGSPLGRVPPSQVRMGGTLPGGYPVRTTEGVLTTRRAVCLLLSRRRTFLFRLAWLSTLALVRR